MESFWNYQNAIMLGIMIMIIMITGLKDTVQEWCCSVLNDYPDFVPGITYGSLSDQSIKNQWATDSCDTRVGGSERKSCKGMWD